MANPNVKRTPHLAGASCFTPGSRLVIIVPFSTTTLPWNVLDHVIDQMASKAHWRTFLCLFVQEHPDFRLKVGYLA